MQSWQTLASRALLDRPPWLSVWEQEVKLPNGHVIHDYLVTVARDYAMVFALCEDGRVPLVHQYKHGVGYELHDLPAGYLDSGEPALEAARRELREETGLTAPQWQALGSFVIDSNRGNTRAHLFLARAARLTDPQELDDTEDLNVSFHSPDELRELAFAGGIESLASLAGIMMGLEALQGS
jgi:8-oxo-dGTP pyrophosphatase MutT (NUDIX family)